VRRARESLVAALALALAGAGCGSPARLDWLPDPGQLERWPYGAAVAVTTSTEKAGVRTGELIAIGIDSLYVLDANGLATIPRAEVRAIEVRADWEGANESRFSTRSRTPQQIEEGWKRMEKFARYPGGLPDSLDRAALELPSPRKRGTGTFLNP
jgi:hypothetical protein